MTGADTRQAAPAGPVTYFDASSTRDGRTWLDARDRYDELTQRDLSARARATLVARGTYDPAVHGSHDPEPLTLAEYLEVLANGEVVARVYRHPVQVDRAVQAGATWAQIAAAMDCTEDQARADYRRWAEGQHRLWRDTGRWGLGDAEYAAAITRSGPAAAERAGGDEDQAAVILAALDDAATLIRKQAALCLVCETHPAALCEEHAEALRRAESYSALASQMGGAR